MNSMIRSLSTLIGCLLLTACSSMSTSYQQPPVTLPASWQQAPSGGTTLPDAWWSAFEDPALDALVSEALARNNDLGTALLNVRRAQLLAGLADDARYPQAGASAGGQTSRHVRGDTASTRSYSLTGSVSWEIDLWNRLGSSADAARLEALATQEDYQAAELTLVGTLANLYWQIGYLNERIAASEQSIAYARQTLQLVQVRFDAGQGSSLELAEARQSLESQQASHVALLQERVEQRNALALLFDGSTPVAFAEPQTLAQTVLPEVDADLPASLLGRRPDLRAAELRLRSSLKSVDAIRASYYPDLSLTGTLGYASDRLGDVLRNPVAALGAGLTLPFLQWNQMQLDIAVSRTDYELAVVGFRQSLYQALVDVENNLAARRHYAEQEAMRERALEAALEAERIYRIRYEAGAVDLQSWLSAQDTRRTAQVSLTETRLNRLQAQVALTQALGGGVAQP